jgi:sterol 3beta-glucosyltransferase
MKVALLAHGTRGDVQPAVAVANRLAHRGHQPVLCVNADLAGWAGRSGHRVVASDLDAGATR